MTAAALLIGDVTHCKPHWESFASFLTLKQYPAGTREEFIANCKAGLYDDVVILYHSNAYTKITGPFDAELIPYLPASVKYICHLGAGYDNIDTEKCTEHNILVSHTPVVANQATADVALFLMLGALRRAYIPQKAIREGQWHGKNFTLGNDPEKKTLGILGMGGIGKEVARRARAFDMNIIYHNTRRLPLAVETEYSATHVSFDDLLSQSDVLSLNLALKASTRHIIGKPEFEKMKTGIVIVNTARGALIDEKALVEALESGKVASAGLDVFEEEPKVTEELLQNERVMLLPHIGTSTYETHREMETLVLNNVESAFKQQKLLTVVAEQKEVHDKATAAI